MAEQRELSGWRQIADYLGLSVRTVQTYERIWGLPIHRLPGKKGRTWATTQELAAWKEKQAGQNANQIQHAGMTEIVEPPCINAIGSAEQNRKGLSCKLEARFAGHWVHVLIGSALLGLILASTVPLEVAFAYDRFARLVWIASPIILISAAAAAIFGLAEDVLLTRQGKSFGLVASVLVLVFSAAVNYFAVRPYLPVYPLTQATFQTWTAQAAYLKGLVYCTAFASVFVSLSFHFVITMQREFLEGRQGEGFELLTKGWLGVAPRGAPYLPTWVFGVLLLAGAIYSIISTAHLLEALKVTRFTNLFIQLIEIRWALFLALGVECCWWYYSAVNELKREYLDVVGGAKRGRIENPHDRRVENC